MIFHIDSKCGKPVYLQLVDQVRYAAASGALRPGDPLPSIRPLAEELRANRNTVAKAYAELESLGVIETIGGKGCFLKENDSPLTKHARHKLLSARIDEAVVTAYQMKVGPQVLRDLLDERIRFFDQKKAVAQPAAKQGRQIEVPASPLSTSPISADVMASWTPSTD